MNARLTLLAAFAAVASGCLDLPKAPAPPEEVEPAYVRFTLDSSWGEDYIDYPDVFISPSVILRDSGVHVIYINWAGGKLRYAGCVQNCSARQYWYVGTADSGYEVAAAAAAALDSTPRFHVLYQVYSGPRHPAGLKYATCPGGCNRQALWQLAMLVTGVAAWPALAAEPAGALHASYVTEAGRVYAYCPGGCADSTAWQRVVLDTRPGAGETQLALDPQGRLHLLYVTADYSVSPSLATLRYATCATSCNDSSSWTLAALDAADYGYRALALAAGPDGRAHVLYRRWSPPITYATCATACGDPASWQKGALSDQEPNRLAIAVDAAGGLHAAIGVGRELSITRCSGPCLAPGGWISTPVIGDPYDYPYWVGLAADADARERVVYGDYAWFRYVHFR